MTDSVILAAAGVRAIDPDYEPTALPGRWAPCYDALHHRYVVRYVQPLGLMPVKARTGDEAIRYDPIITGDGRERMAEARRRGRETVIAARDAELDALEAVLREQPMTSAKAGVRFGHDIQWLTYLSRKHPDRFCKVYKIGGKTYIGVVGVSYVLPQKARLIR